MIYSFDVFDTCISRFFYNPSDLFYQLAQDYCATYGEFQGDEELKRLCAARMSSEVLARQKSAFEDVDLDEIYKEFSKRHRGEFDADKIKSLEMDLELRSVYPIKNTLDEYLKLLALGEKVIFISDMYLPEELIRSMLVRCGFFAAGKQGVYVSGVLGLTKRSGRLFEHVAGIEEVSLDSILHSGDNPVSDFKVPASLGLRTKLVGDRGVVGRYEERLSRESFSIEIVRFLRNKSRLIRKCLGEPTGALTVAERIDRSRLNAISKLVEMNGFSQKVGYAHVSAFILSPLANLFVIWLLQKAREEKVEKLYFVSRNGYLFYRLAKKYVRSHNIKVTCHYLYGSRRAWYAASQVEIDSHFINLLREKYPDRTLEEIFHDFSFSAELIEKLRKFRASLSADVSPVEFFRSVRGSWLHDEIRSSFSFHRKLLLDYLDGQGFCCENGVGLVDVGWHLSAQSALSRALYIEGRESHYRGFYFAVGRKRDLSVSEGNYFSLFSGAESAKYSWLFKLGPMSLLEEVLFAADHGSTKGYYRSDGMTLPLYSDNNPEYLEVNSLVQSDALLFCSELSKFKLSSDVFTLACLYMNLFRLYYCYPTRQDVLPVGKIGVFARTSHDVTERREMARSMSFREVLVALWVVVSGKRSEFLPGWVWFQGSIALTNGAAKSLGMLLSLVDGFVVNYLRRGLDYFKNMRKF